MDPLTFVAIVLALFTFMMTVMFAVHVADKAFKRAVNIAHLNAQQEREARLVENRNDCNTAIAIQQLNSPNALSEHTKKILDNGV